MILNDNSRGHPRLAEARPPHARRFAVRHYAGEVSYDAADFLEANRDAVPDDLLAAFDNRTCEFGFATHLFGAELKVCLGIEPFAQRMTNKDGSAS